MAGQKPKGILQRDALAQLETYQPTAAALAQWRSVAGRVPEDVRDALDILIAQVQADAGAYTPANSSVWETIGDGTVPGTIAQAIDILAANLQANSQALIRTPISAYDVSISTGRLYECQGTVGTLFLPAGSTQAVDARIEFEHDGTGTLSIVRNGSDLINGGTSHTLVNRYEVCGVRWTGSEWRVY